MRVSLATWRSVMLGSVFALLVLGAIAIYSASGFRYELARSDGTFILRKHIREIFLGLVLMVGAAILPPKLMRRSSAVLLVIAELMLIAVLIPGIGKEYNGSRRWFSFGGTSFQPSEFAKIALFIFLVSWVATRGRKDFARFWPSVAVPLGVVFFTALLIEREPDKSTAAFIVLVSSILLLAGGVRFRHIAATYGAIILIVLLIIGVALVLGYGEKIEQQYTYAQARMDIFLNQFRAAENRVEVAGEYQNEQSVIALALGAKTGMGPGKGLQQQGYLPHCDSDYIFAIIGQEFGFYKGSLVVIGLFALFVISGLQIAFGSNDKFCALLCFALVVGIGIQAAIHIAVVTGMVPPTGIALPFISRGGSALMMSLVAVGLVLSVARSAAQRTHPEKKRVIAKSIRPQRRKVEAKDFSQR